MKNVSFWRIMWGLLFIAAAGVIILQILGMLDGGGISIWLLLVTIPLAAALIAFAVKMQWFGMFIIMAVLAYIYRGYIEPLLDVELSIWLLLGVASLLGIGFHLLFRKRKNKVWVDKGMDAINTGHYVPTVETLSGEKLYFSEQFGGSSKYITSENLSYVSVSNSFGGMALFFDNAKLAPEGAIVDIDNKFGGIELYIPHDWNIVNYIDSFAGAADVNPKPHVDGAPTITLRGYNKFGGVDIKRV